MLLDWGNIQGSPNRLGCVQNESAKSIREREILVSNGILYAIAFGESYKSVHAFVWGFACGVYSRNPCY